MNQRLFFLLNRLVIQPTESPAVQVRRCFAQDFPHKGKDGKNKKKEKALADCTVTLTQGLVS